MNDLSPRRRLVRLPAHGKLGGVCAGMAEYLDADVTVVRLVWVILSIVPGGFIGGAVAYLAALFIVPVSSAAAAPRARVTRSTVDRQIAGVCGGLAEYLNIDSTVVRLAWAVLTIVPGAIVFGVAAYLVAWLIMPERPAAAMSTVVPAPGPA
jgi:phage shock protein C